MSEGTEGRAVDGPRNVFGHGLKRSSSGAGACDIG